MTNIWVPYQTDIKERKIIKCRKGEEGEQMEGFDCLGDKDKKYHSPEATTTSYRLSQASVSLVADL